MSVGGSEIVARHMIERRRGAFCELGKDIETEQKQRAEVGMIIDQVKLD